MPNRSTSLTNVLREAAWLTPERAGAYCAILAGASLLVATAEIALSRHGVDLAGKPLGTDFLSFLGRLEARAQRRAGRGLRPLRPLCGRTRRLSRRGDRLQRVLLSARFPVGLPAARAASLFRRARRLARGDRGRLLACDAGASRRRPRLLDGHSRLPRRAHQLRPRAERLPHYGALRRRRPHASAAAHARRRPLRPPGHQAASGAAHSGRTHLPSCLARARRRGRHGVRADRALICRLRRGGVARLFRGLAARPAEPRAGTGR